MSERSESTRPVAEVSMGAVKGAIWANDFDGGVFHTATFERVYRTPDGEWRSSRSFGERELLLLAKVADAAHTKLIELRSAGEEEQDA